MNNFQENEWSLLQKFCIFTWQTTADNFKENGVYISRKHITRKKKTQIWNIHMGILYTNLLFISCFINLEC